MSFNRQPPTSGFGMGPPPSSSNPNVNSQPPLTGPPMSGQPGYSSQPLGPPGQPPQKPVQFFSLAGGSPTPVTTSSMPPMSSAGSMPPPPGSSIGPPPSGSVPPPGPSPQMGGQFYGVPPPSNPGLAGVPPPPGAAANAYDYGGFGGTAGTSQAQESMGSATDGQTSLPLLSEVDFTLECSKEFIRPTVSKLVNSQALVNACRLPIGLIVSPMAGDKGTNDHIPLVDFGSTGIIRCKRCRSYINPFVVWYESGRRWRCNICGLSNETPSSYFSHLDHQNRRRDRDARLELSCCSVEFLASADYQVRPPQPPTYVFVIDVSATAVSSGMVYTAAQSIKTVLSELPGQPRTQVGFLTFDSSIHFYSLKASLSAPQMLVSSDLSDIVLPLPEDIVVNLQDSRRVVEALLDSLANMFTHAECSSVCTGTALAVARHLLEPTGGKLLLFQSTLPNMGEGTLKLRENPRLLGTDKEHMLLNCDDDFYKGMAAECSKLQICCDVFCFSAQYTDVATLAVLARYTAGECYYYPSFVAHRDGVCFQRDLEHNLTRATAFEAVMRVRATRGLRPTNFHGNFFVRGTDLMSLPTCTSDSVFGIDLSYDEPILAAQVVSVQTALLFTTAGGERRVRVHNILIPIVQSLPEMFESVDIDAVMNLLSKQAVEIALKTGLDNARQRVHQTAIDILKSLRAPAAAALGHAYPGYAPAPQQDLVIPGPLQLLPLYAMSLQKSTLLRGGSDIRFDERAYYHQRFITASINSSRVFIYPRLFSIHDMTTDVGVSVAEGMLTPGDPSVAGPFHIRLPALLNLSNERLYSEGVYLLENSVEMMMWIGRAVHPSLLTALFSLSTTDGVDMSTVELLPDTSEFAARVHAVVTALRQERPERYMQLHLIKEGDGYAEAYFSRFLVEDRAQFQGGQFAYTEYYGQVLRSL